MAHLFDFAIATIFARECLEGSIIIGEYRTIIMRGGNNALAPGITKKEALSDVTVAAIAASALALFVLACVAIPLALLSSVFDPTTAHIIEAISKIVAAISLLQLSLKLPQMLGVYGSCKKRRPGKEEVANGMTRRSIRFNVAWNIWREVAECGVFLIPFFLDGNELELIPLSAFVGSLIGILLGVGLYYANRKLTEKRHLCVFVVMLLVVLSAGLFTGGCHLLERETSSTKEVWRLEGDFWHVDRLPLTIIKPFGYDNPRSELEIVCYWSWLLLGVLLHYRSYRISPCVSLAPDTDVEIEEGCINDYPVEIGDAFCAEENGPSNEESRTEVASSAD